MNNFLPENYEIPQKSNNYMKFEDGENRIRILSSPIIGWLAWETKEDGSKKPIRKQQNEPFKTTEIEDIDSVKHFWAMPVYNYKEERIQILEITQKSIQKSIKALAKDIDWGSPLNYDLVITRSGEKLNTEYQINPKPAKKLDPGIQQLFIDMQIDLAALYRGEDPFTVGNTIAGEQLADDAVTAGL